MLFSQIRGRNSLREIETILKLQERKWYNNVMFNSMDDVIEALSKILNEIYNEKDIIKSLCDFKWLFP